MSAAPPGRSPRLPRGHCSLGTAALVPASLPCLGCKPGSQLCAPVPEYPISAKRRSLRTARTTAPRPAQAACGLAPGSEGAWAVSPGGGPSPAFRSQDGCRR